MELKQDSYSCYLESVLNKCFVPTLSEFCVTTSFQMAIILWVAKHHLAAKNVQTLA